MLSDDVSAKNSEQNRRRPSTTKENQHQHWCLTKSQTLRNMFGVVRR